MTGRVAAPDGRSAMGAVARAADARAQREARSASVDVLIVGGGPAGLVAARVAAEGGCHVLLLERDPAIGAPVRCGEGVGAKGLEEFLDPRGGAAPWVSQRITRVEFRSPNGMVVRVGQGDVGYVLDRTRFESVLADQAIGAGAAVRTGAEVTGLAREPNGWLAHVNGGAEHVRARVVIGADGVESMVGRWAGIDTRVRAKDMESCAQVLLDDVDIDPTAIVLHFGNDIAPGGYAWIFPKGPRSANVGLGVVALRARRTALGYLAEYAQANFPTGKTKIRTVGGVIVQTTVRSTVADGVVLCGDAAHMINPLSGAGIVNAMKAGRLAGETVAEAIAGGDTSGRRLAPFHDRWMHLLGRDHERFYRVKEQLGKFDDAFYDSLACSVNDIPEDRRTLRRIFRTALVQHPALLPVILRYFA
jgi:digeranylgeranylglycerophospholipid reductase